MTSFPDYESESSSAVRMYLKGELGKDPCSLNPYMCSMFFTVDRAIQYMKNIKDILNKDDSIVVCDRYISANLIHQGAKIKDIEERHKFYDWCYEFETETIGLPREAVTIILSLPVEISQKLMSVRYNGDSSKKDIHENSIAYLKECYDTSMDVYKHLKSKGFTWEMVDCKDKDTDSIKPIEVIHNEIIEKLKELGIIE